MVAKSIFTKVIPICIFLSLIAVNVSCEEESDFDFDEDEEQEVVYVADDPVDAGEKPNCIYAGYDESNYSHHLNQFQLYRQQNAHCLCYFPHVPLLAGDIRKFSYFLLQDLVWEKFGTDSPSFTRYYDTNNKSLVWLEFHGNSFECIHCNEITEYVNSFNRLYFMLFKNSFFYSQYRAVLLDLAVIGEKDLQLLDDSTYFKFVTDGLTAIYDYLHDLRERFLRLYSQCLSQHPHPKIYYERGMIYAHEGDWDNALEDISSALDGTDPNFNDPILTSELYLQEGTYYAEEGLYDKAVVALTEAIAKNPENKEAYFERAVAYFETMNFDLALKDYLASGMSSSANQKENIFSIDYAMGLAKGIQKGIQHEFEETLPALAPIMSVGLWALTNSPTPSAKFVTATLGCVAAVGTALVADQMVSELKGLITNWNRLSQKERGELTGFLIGKYGVDVFAVYGSAKCMDAYQSLKKANRLLTFEYVLADEANLAMIKDRAKGVEALKIEQQQALTLAEELGLTTPEMIQLKKTGCLEATVANTQKTFANDPVMRESLELFNKAQDSLKAYKSFMTETQARGLIEQMGIRTFPRPHGIPENYRVKLSKEGAGMRYIHPQHEHTIVRVMPGKPHSPFPYQQKPYVNHRVNGKSLDKNGNTVPNDAPEAHIPVEEFVFMGTE